MKIIGVMTGNSLDAVDVVLSSFEGDVIKDLASYTLAYPQDLRNDILLIKSLIKEYNLKTSELAKKCDFEHIVNKYTKLVAQAINSLILDNHIDRLSIVAIGFHGQTCDHYPPSIAGNNHAYSLQIGNAQLLANLTDIAVIYDFRSDDIMNNGEGAPLAPMHNLHIANSLCDCGINTIAFCNAGNTGNITVIAKQKNQELPEVMGWDIGPFNHLADDLMRKHKQLPFDKNGEYGANGKVQPLLLQNLFDNVAIADNGQNFYLKPPPKSSDPHWYKIIYDNNYSFADNLRTVEYLSAYSYVYNLSYLPKHFDLPKLFLLFGGGWKNPLILDDFKKLIKGEGIILPSHEEIFASIYKSLPKDAVADWADVYGFSGEYMEARIFADMARCKIKNIAFSLPSTTNCQSPTVGGIYVLPNNDKSYPIISLLKENKNLEQPQASPMLWSRAAKGWQNNDY